MEFYMTKRERVISALSHRQPDFVPYEVGFTEKEYEKYAAYVGDPDFARKIGNHMAGCYYSGFSEGVSGAVEGKPDHFRDDFGVVWNRSVDKDIGVIDGYILNEPDLSLLKLPRIDENFIRRGYEKTVKPLKTVENATGDADDMSNGSSDPKFIYGSLGFSMFERAWTLRGMENLLIDMVDDPGFVDGLLDAICEFNMRIVEIGMSYDLDGFYFGDDWGQQKGLIMGPDYWRRYIKPRVARMYQAVKSKGKFVIQHSCGDITEIFPDLIDIGLDCYQTFQPEIYDIKAVKNEFGNDLTFFGGISTQRLLPFATPDEIKLKTAEIMRIMGKGGGYIAAPTHAIPGDVPPENVAAMLEVFQNQNEYI
jgi:uroporphyrinogen decarboxylase